MTSSRRVRWLIAAVAVGALTVAGVVGWQHTRRRTAAAATTVVTSTAAVVRTDLTTTVQLSGTLGYSGRYTAASGGSGTVTAEPALGQTVTRGQPLYELDGSAVYLFYGARPAWRALARGMTPGPDVTQLKQNLTALGFASGLGEDTIYGYATELAVERWQRATGQAITGRVPLGVIAFEPGPVRVTSITAGLGFAVHSGDPILDGTSTSAVVSVPVPVTQSYLVHAGDAVTITMPAGTTIPGTVQSIGGVASGSASESAAGAAPSPGSGGNGPATVPAVMTLADPSSAGQLDQAPVTINVTSRTVTGVLAVPITALVALAGGGYGVYVRTATMRSLVAVTPGLFATTLVQVSSPSLRAGDTVEVPAG